MDDPRQPGPYIRRVGGRVLTDEEMLQYYSGLAREFGLLHACYCTAFAVVDEETQTQGTYVVGAVATEEISEDTTARLTVYGADTLINTDVTNSFTNVDNVDLFIHSATVGFDDVSAISVEPVSLLTPTNTITTGGIWGLLFILVIPAALLIYGFVRWMHRRKL